MPDLDDLNCNAWKRCNHLVHSWLINYVSVSIAQTIVFHDNAFDVWEDLKERFSKVDGIQVANLRSSINTLRVRLVREFWRGGAGRGGEIFNLKCLVQFLEGEGRGGEQIFLKFDCIAIIILTLISNLNINLVTTFIIICYY